jgi:hypothetical protein
MNGTPGRKRGKQAPASHYVIAAVFGTIVTIALSLAVGASNPENFWVAAGITAVCALFPSTSLGVRLFVSNHTITRDPRGEESVELSWMREAAAGAFLDVLVTTIVISVLLMLSRAAVDSLPALLALIGLSAADVSLRYLVIRHRALR